MSAAPSPVDHLPRRQGAYSAGVDHGLLPGCPDGSMCRKYIHQIMSNSSILERSGTWVPQLCSALIDESGV
jgi:hypothetical protein